MYKCHNYGIGYEKLGIANDAKRFLVSQLTTRTSSGNSFAVQKILFFIRHLYALHYIPMYALSAIFLLIF